MVVAVVTVLATELAYDTRVSLQLAANARNELQATQQARGAVALSRLVLDNVPNLQASWVTMGGGVAQAALHMGCDDFGQVMIEENVVSAAGTTFKMDSEEVERHIRDAGFQPARRNMRYQLVGNAA